MDVGNFTVTVEHCVFKGNGTKVDSEGTPVLTLSFEMRGRGAFEKLNIADVTSLIGKSVTLNIIDNQMRLQEG